MQVRVLKTDENAIIPQYQSQGAAGFDLHSCEDFTILPNQTVAISTGLAYEIPEGYELQIRPRSGMAHKSGIQVANSPGTIDSDYRGVVKVLLYNSSDKNFPISIGDRIAQGIITQYERAEFAVVEELSETERGEGGFGSTGK